MAEVVPPLAETLRESMENGEFCALVLSNPRRRREDQPRRESVRPIQLGGKRGCQWELQFDRRQSHLNLTSEESVRRFAELFGGVYREAYLYTTRADFVGRGSRKGAHVTQRAPTRAVDDAGAHDRAKAYLIPEGAPVPFLVALDVMTPQGQVKQARRKKFRQINRYLEIVNDVYPQLPAEGRLRIVDFGCGLSYLTFAVHHLLRAEHGREVELLGVDENAHVVQRCRDIAQEFSLPGLRFCSESISTVKLEGPFDLAISLHACDTATDHALRRAVESEAGVILAAPCCQHELAGRISSDPLSPVLQHGILKERFSAMATDALRACALEAAGYRTQILEFIDLEHTPKNLLIRAVRRTDDAADAKGREQYDGLKAFLGTEALATDGVLTAGRNRAAAT